MAQNPWALASAAIAPTLALCAWMSLRGSAERRLVGVMMTGTIVTLLMVLLSVWWKRDSFLDIPLALAIMSFGSSLLFARFLEKHL
jgi:multicomponent Na+:H+ antiporter subunit F